MRRLLLTGFGPFRSIRENPSGFLAETVGRASLAGLDIRARVLPVSYRRAAAQLGDELADFRPDYVIALGLAAGRDRINVERVADGRIAAAAPDVDGAAPAPGRGRLYGDGAYLRHLFDAIAAGSGTAPAYSDDAGGYVCNHLYYGGLRRIAALRLPTRMAFVHLPQPRRRGAVAMERMERGLRRCLEGL